MFLFLSQAICDTFLPNTSLFLTFLTHITLFWHTSLPSPFFEDPFTVFSYNVLSKSYASKQRYGYVPTWALSWEYRKDIIIREIISCMSDIICLQEVEFDKYEDFFTPQLSNINNYKGLFWPKTRARTMDERERLQVDGCAIFWKSDVWAFKFIFCTYN